MALPEKPYITFLDIVTTYCVRFDNILFKIHIYVLLDKYFKLFLYY